MLGALSPARMAPGVAPTKRAHYRLTPYPLKLACRRRHDDARLFGAETNCPHIRARRLLEFA